MTKIKVKTGDVFTNLKPAEIRMYLQGAVKTGSFKGFEDSLATIPIIIAVDAVVYIYE